jgi:hypothetical protein
MMFLLSLFISVMVMQTQCARDRVCKTTPGSSGWPTIEEWSQLNASTDGRLLQPVPPAAVCHPTQAVYNATRCEEVKTHWADEYFHLNDPVSVEWNNWNNGTCLPDPAFPCSSLGYPVYVINATTATHVKTGLDFGMITRFYR